MARKSEIQSELADLLQSEAVTLSDAQLYGKKPKQRDKPEQDGYDTAIINRYKAGKCSLEETLIEIYLSEMSLRGVEDVSERLWGSKVNVSTVSDLYKEITTNIVDWNNRELGGGAYPYVFIGVAGLRRNQLQNLQEISIFSAVGIDENGFRDALGVCVGDPTSAASWKAFFNSLKARGLQGVKLFITSVYIHDAVTVFFPSAELQYSVMTYYKDVLSTIPKTKRAGYIKALKAIHFQESKEAAARKAEEVAASLEGIQLPEAAEKVRTELESTLTYMEYPTPHWLKIRNDTIVTGIARQVRRRTKIAGASVNESSAVLLMGARYRFIATRKWKRVVYTRMG
jgi:transposase-like protein